MIARRSAASLADLDPKRGSQLQGRPAGRVVQTCIIEAQWNLLDATDARMRGEGYGNDQTGEA